MQVHCAKPYPGDSRACVLQAKFTIMPGDDLHAEQCCIPAGFKDSGDREVTEKLRTIRWITDLSWQRYVRPLPLHSTDKDACKKPLHLWKPCGCCRTQRKLPAVTLFPSIPSQGFGLCTTDTALRKGDLAMQQKNNEEKVMKNLGVCSGSLQHLAGGGGGSPQTRFSNQ